MKSQIAGLCGLASLASALTTRPSVFARQEAATCIDCTIPLVANSNFANGVVAEGNYYSPTKTGNWLLADTVGGVGELSVVQDPTGNYLRNFCAKGRSGYCSVYLAQVVTVQAGVSYDFRAQYAISGVRGQANTVSVQLGSLNKQTRYFEQFTYAGNTDWTTFGTSEWVSPISGDILMTVIWRNDPNDGIVKYRSLKLEAVECRKPDSPFNCANQQTSTTTTAQSTTTTAAATTTTSDTTTSTTDATTTTSDTTTSTTDSTTTTAAATTTTPDTTTSTTNSTSTTASTTNTSATSTQASTTLSTRTRRPGKCGRKSHTRKTASTTSGVASSTTASLDIASSTTAAVSTTESETVTVAPITTTSAVAASTTVIQSMTVY